MSEHHQMASDVDKAALVSELQRLYGRLTPTVTGNNMNTVTALAVAAGALAATQAPLAFVAIPIFWSAWLLHALMLDLETLKYGAHARWLEKRAQKLLGVDIFISESRLTLRSQRKRPPVFYASFIYTTLLNLGSWIGAVAILLDRGLTRWAFLAAGVATAVFAVAIWTVIKRPQYAKGYDDRLNQPTD